MYENLIDSHSLQQTVAESRSLLSRHGAAQYNVPDLEGAAAFALQAGNVLVSGQTLYDDFYSLCVQHLLPYIFYIRKRLANMCLNSSRDADLEVDSVSCGNNSQRADSRFD